MSKETKEQLLQSTSGQLKYQLVRQNSDLVLDWWRTSVLSILLNIALIIVS